ncbi:Inner membrane protein YedI [Novipirellula galeiformis]|uniref:Inner membrane protein YedI n=2 Tax=Novipirellula galeiformis TaxID=2528004 RepID=A0A5C6CQW2_9BACT|nr:Inner membrane protein YedI [Novipirellula galeiformis]
MASGLLMLLDDIATILDDIAILTKVAAKKTAGVLGDDLALNAQQVTGVDARRELPVVWAVAKGSLLNKAILVPIALALSALASWSITPLLIVGGLYLCFEGVEKLAHKFLHRESSEQHEQELGAALANPNVDMVAIEKEKIRGAIRTDFILSAEIVVITLGTVATSPIATRLLVLVAISILMTVGVYGLVAGIVKIDDLGMRLIRTESKSNQRSFRQLLGYGMITSAPYLMKFLSVAGTVAMFLVGGGILTHGIPPLHHLVEWLVHPLAEIHSTGAWLSSIAKMILDALLGLIAGTICLLIVSLIQRWRGRNQASQNEATS